MTDYQDVLIREALLKAFKARALELMRVTTPEDENYNVGVSLLDIADARILEASTTAEIIERALFEYRSFPSVQGITDHVLEEVNSVIEDMRVKGEFMKSTNVRAPTLTSNFDTGTTENALMAVRMLNISRMLMVTPHHLSMDLLEHLAVEDNEAQGNFHDDLKLTPDQMDHLGEELHSLWLQTKVEPVAP